MQQLFQTTLTSITRNKLLSLGLVSIVFLVTFFLLAINGLGALMDKSVADMKENVDFTVFLQKEVSLDNPLVVDLQNKLKEGGVEVELISSEKALENLKKFTNIPEIIDETASFVESYRGNAILQPVVVLRNVSEGNPERLNTLINDEKYKSIIDFTYFDEQLDRIKNFTVVIQATKVLFVLLYVLFLGIASLIIFNTTRILLQARKSEVQIMELVGAKRRTIQAPFFLETFMLSTAGAIIGLCIFVFLLFQWDNLIASIMKETAVGSENLLKVFIQILLVHFQQSWFWELLKIIVLFGVVSALSTWLAIRRFMPNL